MSRTNARYESDAVLLRASTRPKPVRVRRRWPYVEGMDAGSGEELVSRANRLNRASHAVHSTFAIRDSAPAAYAAWKAATEEAKAAHDAMYPRDLWELVAELKVGSHAAVQFALRFLEVDPWCFRSGYAKELIARRLRKVEVTDEQRDRLGKVLIHAVDVGDRREFSEYCKLARAHAKPPVRVELKARLTADDAGVGRRALVMVTSLRKPRLTS